MQSAASTFVGQRAGLAQPRGSAQVRATTLRAQWMQRCRGQQAPGGHLGRSAGTVHRASALLLRPGSDARHP